MTNLQVEGRFAVVPEWVIDASISDSAFRLYAVLLRYGQSSGSRMPSRATLAARLRKSVDTVDRAMKELVTAGAVEVEHRRRGAEHLSNRYHVMTTDPRRRPAATRTSAAADNSTPAVGVAAPTRPDPKPSTQSTTPPPPDLEQLATECQATRRRLGLPTARWTPHVLADVIHRAVNIHGWPAEAATPALLALAADRQTRSPARLEHPGPWWDAAEATLRARERDEHADELRELETWLAEAGGARVTAQRQARTELARAGRPLTPLAVARLAAQHLGHERAAS